ncbi:hypothetical protein [Burkholderia diffusa]|uniref:hypothetical protein n=1 Tax=Burkholderia diffusa TaxID=488732 RepID=UPI0008413B2F|nr:hypothetical protein WI26_20150 [Burkholderia diffusa]
MSELLADGGLFIVSVVADVLREPLPTCVAIVTIAKAGRHLAVAWRVMHRHCRPLRLRTAKEFSEAAVFLTVCGGACVPPLSLPTQE